MIDRELPETAAEAFQELSDLVVQLANMAAPMGVKKATDISSRACFLIGSLEMSAEMGGNWKGHVPDAPLKRGNAMKRLEKLEKQLRLGQ